jgi:hypothetical protein
MVTVIRTDASLIIWHEHTVLIPRQMSVGQLASLIRKVSSMNEAASLSGARQVSR